MIKLGRIKFFTWGRTLHPTHGPQSWPWWRLLVFKPVRSRVQPPSLGWNLWFYTRWGAKVAELYIDRRRA